MGRDSVDPVSIRAMTESDWLEFAPVWREVVAAGETYADPLDATDADARALWLKAPPAATMVAVETARDGTETVLGSATMGDNRPGRGSHVGTASVMVAGAARGRGVGRLLGRYAVDWHREQGFAAIQFDTVVEINTAAVARWRSLGFEIIATVPAAFDSIVHGRVRLHVMHLEL